MDEHATPLTALHSSHRPHGNATGECWSTCWDHHSRIAGTVITPELVVDFVFCSVFVAAVALVLASDRATAAREQGAKPRYGVGGGDFIKALSAAGALLAGGEVFGYFVFYAYNDDISCLVQHNDIGFPIASTFIAYFVCLIVFGNLLRMRNAAPWARRLGLSGTERTLVLNAKRGVFANAVAAHAGHVVAYGENESALGQREMRWLVENAERERLSTRVTPRTFHGRAKWDGVEFRLDDTEDGEFDVAVLPYVSSLPCVTGGASLMQPDAKAKKRSADRLVTVLRRVMAACKPGGRVVATALNWSADAAVAAMKEAGLEDVAVRDGKVYLTLFSSRQIEGRVPDTAPAPSRDEAVGLALANTESESAVEEREAFEAFEAEQQQEEEGERRAANPVLLGVLFGTFVVLYVTLGVIMPLRIWCDVLRPKHLPWNNQLSSLVVTPATLLPFSFAAAYTDLRLQTTQPEVTTAGVVSLATRAVVDMVLGLTVYNLLFWLPSFVIDLALYGKISDGKITAVNIVVGTVVYTAATRYVPAAIEWWKRRKAARAAKRQQQHSDPARVALLSHPVA